MTEPVSYSQNGQDRFVAEMVFAGKRNGFFIEAGAGDGLWISNTLLLEQKYDWTGILTLQLRFSWTSESMGNHDSEDHGWWEHRLRRRLSFGHLRYEM